MSLPISHIITTNRLRLIAPSTYDFPHIFSATRFPNFNDGMLWEAPDELAQLVAPLERNLSAWKEGLGYSFSIWEKDGINFLGRISIRRTEQQELWNVGFWTHPEQQGKGIMTEALEQILDLGFTTLDAKQIEACYATWNIASERVLQKNGFTFVKFLEKGFKKKGVWVAENLYAIDELTWRSRRLARNKD